MSPTTDRARRLRAPQSRRGRWIAVAGVALVLLAGGLATVSAVRGGASAATVLEADEVPAGQVDAIARAALACPTLTAARLAGQVMAASAFRADATTPAGGSGVAGLTDAQWNTWAPWSGAVRGDPAAETTALAHLMCDLGAQVRLRGLSGDLWQPALGAYRSGVAAVAAAHGVPDDAADYVRTVAGYAAWYAAHQVSPSAPPVAPEPAPTGGAAPEPVPAELVQLVVAAGAQCPEITAPRIAGQLMAASAFRPGLVGTGGAEGIAQFLPTLWNRYGRTGQSPLDPATAIPTLATAMCSLTSALHGLTAEAYPLALASFRDGPQLATTAADGGRFAGQVQAYATYYARDPRLATAATVAPHGTATAPGPAAAPGKTGPAPATPTTAAAGRTTVPGKATTTPKTTTKSTTKSSAYAIEVFGDRCITVPTAADGARLEIRSCTGGGDQKWTTGSGGTLRSGGLCMDLAWGSSDNGTPVQVATCSNDSAQHFYVNSSNDLVEKDLGKCVDVVDDANTDGALLQLWDCTGAENQKWAKS